MIIVMEEWNEVTKHCNLAIDSIKDLLSLMQQRLLQKSLFVPEARG